MPLQGAFNVTQTWLKALLIPALAASMLVGCTDLPTTQKTPAADAQPQAITSAAVKEFLSEVKQLLASVRSVNGASPVAASAASGYRLSGYAVAEASNSWQWATTLLEDGTTSMTRHVIEKNASDAIVTDIQSTRTEKTTDGVRTYQQEDVVTRSASMAPGTYTVTGKTTITGSYGEAGYKTETEQTTTYTPAEGSPRTTTLKSTYTPAGSVLTLTGLLADGSTIAYKSTQTGATSNGQPQAIKTTMDLSVTSPSGKTIVVENALDNVYAMTQTTSSNASKGFYQVSLGTLMQVRFDIDIESLGTLTPSDNGGSGYTYTYPRNQITAELRDATGKRIAAIGLEATTDHSKPPTKGTLTLEGEEPSELDMSFMMDIMRVQMSLPY